MTILSPTDSTRTMLNSVADFRGRSNSIWSFTFVFFGVWMVFAMMAYLMTAALFSAVKGGAFIFLFVPIFYVYVIGQATLLIGWRDKSTYKGNKSPGKVPFLCVYQSVS